MLFTTFRWFRRASAYAHQATNDAITSDVIYAIACIGGISALYFGGMLTISSASLTIAGAHALGSLPVQDAISAKVKAKLSDYGAVWRSQASWATVGVVSTEATTNAHAYLVALLVGPAAYAPIALSALLWRPMSLSISSLTQIERPFLARAIADHHTDTAKRHLKNFQLILAAALAANAIVAAAVLLFAFELFAGRHYRVSEIATPAAIWLLIMMTKVIREPEGVYIQAARRFRELAIANLTAAPVSIISALALLALYGPAFSLIGILLGEITMTAVVHRLCARFAPKPETAITLEIAPEHRGRHSS